MAFKLYLTVSEISIQSLKSIVQFLHPNTFARTDGRTYRT